jgi:lipoprotein-anchoring transpeptidase ErfK/SrfK/peptidoglycan hydrolase-like protein with peptidoglycan-binding domain
MPQTLFRTQAATHIIARVSCLSAGLGLAIVLSAAGSTPADAQRATQAANSGEYQLAYHIWKKRRRYVRRRRKPDTPIATPAWFPKEELKDPIQVIVSLPEQKLTVYRGDKPLVTSRLSSGKSGYSTPSGVFSILQKNRYHYSNIYRGAPMPYMQRLTWSGIAFHGSNSVPKDRPASHGCIRLPHSFARQLFKFTEKGAHVVVANEKAVEPFEITHDNLFQPSPRAPKDFDLVEEQWVMKRGGIKIEEKKVSTLPVRVLVTRRTGKELFKDMQRLLNELSFGAGDVDGYMGPDTAKAIRRFQKTYGLPANGFASDELIRKLYEVSGKGAPVNGHLYVRQDFNPVFDLPVRIRGGETPLGSHMFTAMHFEPGDDETRWLAVTLKKGSGSNAAYGRSAKKKKKPVEDIVLTEIGPKAATAEEALGRIEIPKEVRTRIAEMLTPGSSFAVTNDGISRETTPKGSDFIVLMQ